MLPMAAGKYPDGTDASYADEAMRPFWEAVEEADITVCFHIGENIQGLHRGGTGTFLLQSFMPFRKIVGEKIGRASCRERVCQYVEIPVVAVSLKKKIKHSNNK